MRKIDITSYEVILATQDGQMKTDFYDTKESLLICLFHPSLQLDGRELLERGKLQDKIMQANGTVMLEEAEYEKLKNAFESIKGFSKNDLELVGRVLNAKEIEVKEKGA